MAPFLDPTYRGASGNAAMVEMRTQFAIERADLVTLHLQPARQSSIPTERPTRLRVYRPHEQRGAKCSRPPVATGKTVEESVEMFLTSKQSQACCFAQEPHGRHEHEFTGTGGAAHRCGSIGAP
jgi:hypothetical protein